MAKKITGSVKLQIEAGKATPAPPVGTALGPQGVNIMDFCKNFNAKTAKDEGLIIPVVVTIYADRSYTFITKTPPASVLLKTALGSISNPGPHGLSEVVYAFTSQANNNGSAFAGLNGNTTWYNVTGAIAMLIGRFFLMIPVLAIAGSLARKQPVPASAGTFPTASLLFFGLLLGVVILVVGLTYFPVLALGPIVEHLVGHFPL